MNLNAITIFGKEIPWTMETALFWLLVAQVVLVFFLIFVFAILMRRLGKNKTEVQERTLVSITIDTSVVQKEFPVGGEFNCNGLLVVANYSVAPFTEELKEDYDVIAPDMTQEGKAVVTVKYNDMTALYPISIVAPAEEPVEEPVPEEAPAEEPVVEEVPAEEPVAEEVPAEEPVAEEVPAEEPVAEEVPAEEPAPVPDDLYLAEGEYEGGRVRYDRSFTARLIQADAEIQGWYTELKNDFLSYKKVKDRMSWKRETYRFGRDSIVRFAFRGKTLCAYFALEPADFEGSKYKVEDVSDSTSYADTPCMYRIKNDRRKDYAKELMAIVMARYETERIEREPVDYSLPYEDDPTLLRKQLIKRIIEGNVVFSEIAVAAPAAAERALVGLTINTDAVKKEFTAGAALDTAGLVVKANYNAEPFEEDVTDFAVIAPDMDKAGNPTVVVSYQNMTVGYPITVAAAPVAEPEPAPAPERKVVVVEEESVEGGTVRYDRSFTARFIQSDDELKTWYNELKNDMLAYKRVHDRMSWKRESYRIGRDTVARLAFRGKTLCLYLALDPADFEGSKYKVEDVSDNSGYADTPCMYRIKNDRRVKYAEELFAIVAAAHESERTDREAVDYYLPYQGIVELINSGLAKREIKSNEELFFVAKKDGE